MNYNYVHAATEETTGYFACLPDPPPGLEEGLRLLEKRPLDIFLHKHLAPLVMTLSEAGQTGLTGRCLAAASRPLAGLLLECGRLAPSSPMGKNEDALGALARPWHRFAPMAILFVGQSREERELAALASANIKAHAPLPYVPQGRPPADASGLSRAIKTASLPESGTLAEPDAKEIHALALEALGRAGLLEGPEMRHEASLSPIALLRRWRIDLKVDLPAGGHSLSGIGTAYGRGLSLAGARAACLMEIVERAAAHAGMEPGGEWGQGQTAHSALSILRASLSEMEEKGLRTFSPLPLKGELARIPLAWLPGQDCEGKRVFLPCQAVFLFCALGEPALFESMGSTGLASGFSLAGARLSALLEALEREAHAITPFDPASCFEPASRNGRIQSLLDDYHAKGIFPQFQDISHPCGLPVWRCFVMGRGGRIAQATGAGLNGGAAALSALTETPWPYSWATPWGKPSSRGIPDLPHRFLEDLPVFGAPSAAAGLAALEAVLAQAGRKPVYADIGRRDLGFPVARAFVPGASPCADFDALNPPPASFSEPR